MFQIRIRKEIKTINKEIISVLIVTFMFVMIFGMVKIGMAGDTDTVNCNVSGVSVSLSLTPGEVDYGQLELSAFENTTASGVGNIQNVENDGTVEENFQIQTSVASGVAEWLAKASQGVNEYTHNASIDSGSSWNTEMVENDTYYVLINDIAKDAGFNFDLQIGMPSGTDSYDAHTITITVMATDST